MPCSAPKSSISSVSGMLPINHLARQRRFPIRVTAWGGGCVVAGASNWVILLSRLSSARKASRPCGAATVFKIKSKHLGMCRHSICNTPSAQGVLGVLHRTVECATKSSRSRAVGQDGLSIDRFTLALPTKPRALNATCRALPLCQFDRTASPRGVRYSDPFTHLPWFVPAQTCKVSHPSLGLHPPS